MTNYKGIRELLNIIYTMLYTREKAHTWLRVLGEYSNKLIDQTTLNVDFFFFWELTWFGKMAINRFFPLRSIANTSIHFKTVMCQINNAFLNYVVWNKKYDCKTKKYLF